MNAFQKVLIIFIVMTVVVIIAGMVLGDEKILKMQQDFLSNTELNYIMPQTKVEYNYNKGAYLVEKNNSIEPDECLNYSSHTFIYEPIKINMFTPKDFVLNKDKSLQNGTDFIYTYVEPIPEKYDKTYSYDLFVKDYISEKYIKDAKSMIVGNITSTCFFENEFSYYYFTANLNDNTTNYFFVTTCSDNVVTIQYKTNEKEIDKVMLETIFQSTDVNKISE